MRPAELPLLHAKHLTQSIKPDLVAYCDSRDLIAVVTTDGEVVVYRINGQVAFTVKRRLGEDAQVTAVSWKQDGSCLAVGWDDGSYGLYSGENGKIVSRSSLRETERNKTAWKLDLALDFGADEDEDEKVPVVKCFGWNSDLPPSISKLGDGLAAQDNVSTEDWLDGLDDDEGRTLLKHQSTGDHDGLKGLARTITSLDATSRLPKMSAIPSHGLRAGPEGSKFASQLSTDTFFQAPTDLKSNAVDTLFVCASNGSVQMLMNETVRVGTCSVEGWPLKHAATSTSHVQAVLSRDSAGSYNINNVILPLDALGGPLLHVIATNTKRIQNLLDYVEHTVRCMHHDLTTGMQFPTRLLNNMNAELSEKNEEGDVVLHLYHLALTGEFTPTMLEWLVDIVKDTNHKRWDTAITGLYTNIQSHIFINLLPALDRLTIATTTLRGHAKFHEGSGRFDVPPDVFTRVLDAIDSLRVVAQKLQLIVMEEHKQFRAFSKWLRVMIDIGVAGPGGKTAIEMEEREVPNIDYPLLLEYVSESMISPKIKRHVEPLQSLKGTTSSQEEFFCNPTISGLNYDTVTNAMKHMKHMNEEQATSMKESSEPDAGLNLPTLAVYLSGTIRAGMERITLWQSAMLTSPTTVSTSILPDSTMLDMTMQASGNDTCVLTLTNNILSIHTLGSDQASQDIDLPQTYVNATLLSASFSDPVHSLCILALIRSDSSEEAEKPDHHLVHLLPSASSSSATTIHTFSSSPASQTQQPSTTPRPSLFSRSTHDPVPASAPSIAQPPPPTFTPENFLVGGRPEKRVCLVWGNGGRDWRVLDLSASPAFSSPSSEDDVRGGGEDKDKHMGGTQSPTDERSKQRRGKGKGRGHASSSSSS